jgi:hypothetical protein
MPEETTAPVSTAPASAAAEAAPPPAAEPRTFSQEEVNRIVKDRLATAEPKYAELRDKAAKFEELEAASQSELEKAQSAATKAEQERDDAIQRANQTLVKAAVIAEAAKQGAIDPDAVVALMPSNVVTIGDDGQVTGATEAVKSLLESKTYLVGEPTPAGPGDGGARTPVAAPSLDDQIKEAEQAGDIKKSMALKSQKMVALTQDQR